MKPPAPISFYSRFHLLTVLKVVLIVALLAATAYLFMTEEELFRNPQLIKARVLSWGAWGPIVFMLLYAFGPSLLVPGAVMTLAAGLAFGTVRGSVFSIIGADLGALVAFGAGRFLGKGFVNSMFSNRFGDTLDKIARNGFQIILYLRVFPIIPYNALNLLAGASPISFKDYFWASMIGMIPGTILFAFLGNELWHPTSPRFLLALLLIALSFAGGELYRRTRVDRNSAVAEATSLSPK
ncbi:MAG TPA: TVP38/TMEM64 family protein [Candidatus Binataceae bacterium]